MMLNTLHDSQSLWHVARTIHALSDGAVVAVWPHEADALYEPERQLSSQTKPMTEMQTNDIIVLPSPSDEPEPSYLPRQVGLPLGDDGDGSLTVRRIRPELAIETAGLTKDFPSTRAVDDLTLEVPRGSIFGFLGPNGAGKTTTIRLLLGLQEATRGSARVLGFDCAKHPEEVRKRCGVLLEQSGLMERLSALDNLDLYGRMWRLRSDVRARRIEELLRRLNLWERREDRVRTWSRGMKQKLAIARTLVHRPALIFLDEPTAGLDPVAASELRDDLSRLARQEKVTVFLNTHNLGEAGKLCDHVGVIREGRLLAVGTPEELRERRGSGRVLIAGSGFSANMVELLAERVEVDSVREDGGRLVVELNGTPDVSPLIRFLVRLGADVSEVRATDNTLEEVFLSLVTGQTTADGSWLMTPKYRRA